MLEEIFKEVDCSFTRLGVIVLKLTIIVNQIYSLIEANGVFSGDILGRNKVQRKFDLTELVHITENYFSAMGWTK